MLLEPWTKKFDACLKKRTGNSISDLGLDDSEVQAYYSSGQKPDEAAKEYIERRDLDDITDPATFGW